MKKMIVWSLFYFIFPWKLSTRLSCCRKKQDFRNCIHDLADATINRNSLTFYKIIQKILFFINFIYFYLNQYLHPIFLYSYPTFKILMMEISCTFNRIFQVGHLHHSKTSVAEMSWIGVGVASSHVTMWGGFCFACFIRLSLS